MLAAHIALPFGPAALCSVSALRRLRALLLLGGLLLCVSPAQAANVTWTLAGNGNWDVAANWSSNPNLPGSADIVANLTTFTITHDTGNDTVTSFLTDGEFALSGGSLTVTTTLTLNNTFTISNGATLRSAAVINANNLVLTNAILDSVTLDHSLDLSGGGTVFLVNSFTAPGTILVDNNGSLFYEGNLKVNNDVQLGATTSGTLAAGFSSSSNSSGLTSGHTISGRGNINNYGNFTNDGTLLANISGGTLNFNDQNTGIQFTNASDGVLRADGGTLSLGMNTLDNAGLIEARASSTLAVAPSTWVKVGQIQANGANAIVQLGGSFHTADITQVTSSGGGQIQLFGTLINTGSSFDPTTIPQDASSSFLLSGGTIQGGSIVNSNSLLFSSGTLDSVTVDKGLNVNGGNAFLVNSFSGPGTILVDNNGNLFYEGNLTVNNDVQLGATSSGTLATGFSSGSNTTGLAAGHTISGHGQILNYGNFTNDGTILANLSTGGLNFNDQNTGTQFINASDGTLQASNGAGLAFSTSNPVSNAGTIQADTGSTISFNKNMTQTGGSTKVDGTLTLTSSGSTLDIQGGALSGIGTINGSVSNASHVHPGDAPGTLTISGNYTQTSLGNLDIDLGGSPTSGPFGHLKVGGNAALDGALNVGLVNGFIPTVGSTYDILDYSGTLSGQFASANSLTSGLLYTVSYTDLTNGIVIHITRVPAVPGPDSLLVLGLGLAGVAARLRRRRASA